MENECAGQGLAISGSPTFGKQDGYRLKWVALGMEKQSAVPITVTSIHQMAVAVADGMAKPPEAGFGAHPTSVPALTFGEKLVVKDAQMGA